MSEGKIESVIRCPNCDASTKLDQSLNSENIYCEFCGRQLFVNNHGNGSQKDYKRGTYTIEKVNMVHDAGRSLNYLIDLGQAEGGVVQGIGWMTLEELIYDKGKLVSNGLATYKIPDLHFAPEIIVKFLENADNPDAILQSKAIGEPPFMYGIGAYFAIKDAARSFRKDKPWLYSSPITPEKLLLYLYTEE